MAVNVLPASTPEVSTATGTNEGPELGGAADDPQPLKPQQYALPSVSRAHVFAAPTVMAVNLFPDSAPEVSTATGKDESVLELFPN